MIRKALKAHTTAGVWTALRRLRDELQIQRQHRAGLKRTKRFAAETDLKLNLGCGLNFKSGWINIDLSERADLQLDLRERLPFADKSASIIYSEHFFEHLSYANTTYDSGARSALEVPGYPSEALQLLRESCRVLKPRGLFSVGVPDAEEVLKAYAENDAEHFLRAKREVHPAWCKTNMDHVNYTFRQGEQHKYAYDCQTLTRILSDAGFVDVVRREFNPELDTEKRRAGTLYMDARRP